jgi:hypothetical protein
VSGVAAPFNADHILQNLYRGHDLSSGSFAADRSIACRKVRRYRVANDVWTYEGESADAALTAYRCG